MTDALGGAPITEPIASVGSIEPPVGETGPAAKDLAGAERRMATVLTVRLVIAAVVALVSVGAALVLFRTGVSSNDFGPFLADGQQASVDRYTGPWIVAAAVSLLVAGLLLVTAIADGIRASRLRSAASGDST